MSKSLFKMNKKIKNICSLIRNAYVSNKEYVITKDISSNIRYILFFFKRKGLILSFEAVGKNVYEIRLNLKEKKINLSYNEGLRGRKISKKSLPLVLGFNQKLVLMYSHSCFFKVFTLEESYSYNLGGIIMGVLII